MLCRPAVFFLFVVFEALVLSRDWCLKSAVFTWLRTEPKSLNITAALTPTLNETQLADVAACSVFDNYKIQLTMWNSRFKLEAWLLNHFTAAQHQHFSWLKYPLSWLSLGILCLVMKAWPCPHRLAMHPHMLFTYTAEFPCCELYGIKT